MSLILAVPEPRQGGDVLYIFTIPLFGYVLIVSIISGSRDERVLK
jgi:hypothetical protein